MKNKSKILVLSAIALFGMTAAVAPVFCAGSIVEAQAESEVTINIVQSKTSVTSNNIEFSIDDSTGAGYSPWRLYANKSVTVKSLDSTVLITKVVFTTTQGSFTGSCNVGTISSGTWTYLDGAASFKYTHNNGAAQIRISSIKVTTKSSKSLSSIAVSGSMTKKAYYEGDKFDPSGLIVTGTYSDSSTATITEGIDWEFSPTTATSGTTSVSVVAKVGDKTSSPYTQSGITVQADELQSLTLGGGVKGSKGQDWDLSGVTLTGTFASGNKTITDFTPTTETAIPTANGTYSVTVQVSYGGKSATKAFDVVVKATGLTEEDAFTVSEALDIINGFKGTSTKNNGQDVYVKGTVKDGISISTSGGSAGAITFNLTDGTKTIVAYSLWKEDADNKVKWTAGELNVGDKVVAHGYLIDFVSSGNHKAEIGYATGSLAWAKIVRNTQSITKTLTGCSLDVAATFDFDTAFSATLVANAGYSLPESITMTVGGASFTDFTYNNQTGAISIAAGKVNGALVITGVGTKINYTVSTSLTGVILEELPETVHYGDKLETTFNLVEGCVNPQVKVLNNNVDVTASAYVEGNKIALTVQGNVEIIITATPNDLASIAFVEGTDMTKKSYIASEEWDFSGLEVEGVMSSGEKISLDDVTFTADKTVAEAPTSIQVTATYNDKTAVLTISGITVTPVSLASITATPSQDETTFTMGEEFKADNLVVTGVNNDGSTVSAVEGYSVDSSAFNTYAPGKYTITVTKGSLTTSYEVEVVKKTLPTTDLFMKATSASELKAGDEIILVANDANYAMSGTQNTNNRSGVSVIINNGIANITEDIQIITLEEGTKAGTFALKTDEGYLSATSSGSNYLGSRETKTDDSSWEITITSGVASLVAQGNNSRKVMQYNPNNGNPIFSCYSSASQKAICIYKNTPVATGKGDLINLASATLKGEPDLKIGDKLSVNDIAVKGLLNTNEQEVIESGFTFDNANGDGTVTLTQASNTITVKYNSFSIDMVVTAREPAITDETTVDVATSDDKTELFGGETTQLYALLASGEGEPDNKEVTWSSSNEDVATVDQNGLVTTKVVSEDNTKVTITATPKDGGAIGTIELTVNKDDVNGIQLVTGPEQLKYNYGEEFSAEGLKIRETFESGKAGDPIAYDSSTFTLSVADGETLDHTMTSVDVTYDGFTLTNAFTLTIDKVATKLEIEDYNESVYEGQTYTLGESATATVTYSDETTSTVTVPAANVSVDTSTPGDVQGTAFVEVNGVKVETTLDVNVKEDKVERISFVSGPEKYDYNHNDDFNPYGIVVTVRYESGASEEVQYNDERLSYSPTKLSTVGEQKITVTFTDAHGNTASADLVQKVNVSKTIIKVEVTSTEIYKDNVAYTGDIYQSDNISVKATIKTTYSDGTIKEIQQLVSFENLKAGTNESKITVDGVELTIKVEGVIGVALKSITVDTSGMTSKTYIEGQSADLNGLVVTANYNNEVSQTLTSDQYEVSGNTNLVVGQNTVTITYNGITATFTVDAVQKSVTKVELIGTQTETYVTPEEFVQLGANGYTIKVTYDNGTFENIDIANAQVTRENGTVTIAYGGKSASYNVTVLGASNANSITLENTSGTALLDDEQYLFNPGTVTAHYLGTDKTVTLPAGSYTVDRVETNEVGTYTYYVTINNTDVKAQFTVSVNYAPATAVVINGDTTTVYAPGETAQFSATVNPSNAKQNVTWSSSNNSVATVDANGLVTFKKDGTVTITATSVADPTKTCQITLTCETPVINVTGITLDHTELTLDLVENPTAELNAAVAPENASNKDFTWSTSDGSIVYVDQDGNVSALAEGTATITVTTEDGNKTATCVVTVTAPHVDPVEPQKVGCKGSVVAASAIVSGLAIAGASLLVSKKRKEDK